MDRYDSIYSIAGLESTISIIQEFIEVLFFSQVFKYYYSLSILYATLV